MGHARKAAQVPQVLLFRVWTEQLFWRVSVIPGQYEAYSRFLGMHWTREVKIFGYRLNSTFISMFIRSDLQTSYLVRLLSAVGPRTCHPFLPVLFCIENTPWDLNCIIYCAWRWTAFPSLGSLWRKYIYFFSFYTAYLLWEPITTVRWCPPWTGHGYITGQTTIYTYTSNLAQTFAWTVRGNQNIWREPMHLNSTQTRGLNPVPCCCGATALTTAPLCHPARNRDLACVEVLQLVSKKICSQKKKQNKHEIC